MIKFKNAFIKMSIELRTWYELKPFPRTENDRFINNELVDLMADDSYREVDNDGDGNIIRVSHKRHFSFESIFMGVDLLKDEYPSIDFSEIYVILKKYQRYFDKETLYSKEEYLLNRFLKISNSISSVNYRVNKTNEKFDKLSSLCEISFTRLVRLVSELSDTDKD